MRTTLLAGLITASACLGQDAVWEQAEQNAEQTQRAIKFCNRYAQGWLSHADAQTGLLPRNVASGQRFWNAKDCAADNYPFIVLTAYITDNHHLKQIAQTLLQTEQELTNRLDRLPDEMQ